MDSLIPAQLYPKCTRKMAGGETVAAKETLTFKLLSTAEKQEGLGSKVTTVGVEKHNEAASEPGGNFGPGVQVVVTP